MCNICKKVFGYHRNLVAHRKKCGSGIVEENINKKSIKCPDNNCGQLFSGYALLGKHVEEYHKIVLTKEHLIYQIDLLESCLYHLLFYYSLMMLVLYLNIASIY